MVILNRIIFALNSKYSSMENSNVSAIDGIPGIMPGIKSLIPLPPFNLDKFTVSNIRNYHSQRQRALPRTHVRDDKRKGFKKI